MQTDTSEHVAGDLMAGAEAAKDAARDRYQRSKVIVDRSNQLLDRADTRIRESYRRLANRQSCSPNPVDYRAAALPPDVVWNRNSTTSPSAIT